MLCPMAYYTVVYNVIERQSEFPSGHTGMSVELSAAGKVGMGTASVTPVMNVATAKTAATTTTGQGKDTPAADAVEQVSLEAPSKLRQFKALMRKHYSAYKRNKELVYGEVFTTVLYIVLLYIFSLTSGSTVYDADTGASSSIHRVWSSQAALVAPFISSTDENHTSACDGHDCYFAFGDIEGGCSAKLSRLLDRMPMCNEGKKQVHYWVKDCSECSEAAPCFSSPGCAARNNSGNWSLEYSGCNGGAHYCGKCFLDAPQSCRIPPDMPQISNADFYSKRIGIHLPKCKCFDPYQFKNYTFVKAQRIISAVQFQPEFGNSDVYNYTMFVSGLKINRELGKFKSPRVPSGRDYSGISRSLESNVLPIQVAIDSAITGQNITVGVSKFPVARAQVWHARALGNIPFYLTVLVFIGLQSFAGQLAEEGDKGLRQALFMVGLDAGVYWASWVVILSTKLSITNILVLMILAVVVPFFDFVGILFPFILVSMWAVQACILIGLLNVKPKTAQNLIGAGPPLISILPTVLAFMNDNNADAGIPWWAHIVLGGAFPSYSFSMMLTIMLERSNDADGGLRLANYGDVSSSIGVTPVSLALCLIFGNVFIFIVNYFLSQLKKGIVLNKRQARHNDDTQSHVVMPEKEGANRIAVSVRGLRKSFGKIKAVDGLDVDFLDNQITGFLGHNGSGKSTTISLLTGLYNVTGGDAFVYGKSISHDMDAVRKMIGVCPQQNIFWDNLTVEEHMNFISNIRGVKASALSDHVHNLLSDVDMLKAKGHLGSSLSGGMKRKLCVLMALIGDPKVLFLDEPTAGMDSGARRDVWKLLLRKRAGRCIVLCTHYMDEADILSDRLAVINAGKLQDVGTPTEMKLKYSKHIHLNLSLGQGCNRREIIKTINHCLSPECEEEYADSGGEAITETSSGREGSVRLDMSDYVGDEEELRRIEDEILDGQTAVDLSLLLPRDADISVVMDTLEKAISEVSSQVENYGIVSTTLSDVFWEMDQEAGRIRAMANDQNYNASGEVYKTAIDPTLKDLTRTTKDPGSCVKISAIFGQRCKTFVRSPLICPVPFCARYRVPIFMFELFYICAMTAGLLISLLAFSVPSTQGTFTAVGYQNAVSHNQKGRMAIAVSTGREAKALGMTARRILPSMQHLATEGSRLDIPLPLDMTLEDPCLLASLIHIDDSMYCDNINGTKDLKAEDRSPGAFISPREAPGGFFSSIHFDSSERLDKHEIENALNLDEVPTDIEYIVRPNTSNLLALPGSVSFLNTALLANMTGNYKANIAPHIDVLPSYADTEQARERMSASIDLLFVQFRSLFFIMTGQVFTTLAASWARNLVKRKASKLRQLQVLMGIKPWEYVLSHMLYDMTHYLCMLVLPILLIFAVGAPVASGATILLCVGFGFAMIPIMYSLSHLFEKPSAAYSMCSGIFMLVFLVTFMGYFICAIPSLAENINIENLDAVRYVATLWPTTALALGLRAVLLSSTYLYDPLAVTVDVENLTSTRNGTDISSYIFGEHLPVETAFAPILTLFLEGLIFIIVAISIEIGVFRSNQALSRGIHNCKRCSCCPCCYDVETTPFYLNSEDVEDEDVLAERQACSELFDSKRMKNPTGDEEFGQKIAPAVFLHRISHQYMPSGKQRFEGTVAVQDISLRIRNRECFSLLGTNGAGKSTLLNAIMKQLSVKSGVIEINGEDIKKVSTTAFEGMGFCPQQNALLPNHTVREMLRFYARIRGVPVHDIDKYCNQWMRVTQLIGYSNTKCKQLSGGNKRKLSLCIAILGNPSLAVLDEPSAGVDPAARKKLHRVINAVKSRGATIILTTHHMAEAAKLGDRVGIMVQGRLGCLGTPGHLLSKYSEGYVCTVSMARGFSVEESVLPLLREQCPDLQIVHYPSEEYVSVHLGKKESFPLMQLWKALEKLKRGEEVAYFTCGQSNLENVFLRFSALTDSHAILNGDEDLGMKAYRRPLGHAHLSESLSDNVMDEEKNDGTWGQEWWNSSASRFVIRGDAKVGPLPGCFFGRPGGFSSQGPIRDKEWANAVPPRLASRGVTPAEWETFVQGLEDAQSRSTSCDLCRCLHCIAISITIFTGSFGWLLMCCGWSKCDYYQISMRNLLRTFNEEVLERKGMFAKILTFGGVNDEGESPPGMQDKVALPVLVFALTQKEKRRLQAERVLHKPEAKKGENWLCWDCPAHQGRVV